MFHWKNHSPRKLQLAKSNVICLIIIPSGPKFDVLWFFSFFEAWFRRFIKTSNDMSKIGHEWRIFQEIWIDVNLKNEVIRDTHTVQEVPRMDTDEDGAIEMT